MSAERDTKPKSVLTRRIGVGLTRSNLSLKGSRDANSGSPRDAPLTMPTRVVISGASLMPRRTPSDRITTGSSNRLGDLRKNASVPNVTDLTTNEKKMEQSKVTSVTVSNENLHQNSPYTLRTSSPQTVSSARGISRLQLISERYRHEHKPSVNSDVLNAASSHDITNVSAGDKGSDSIKSEKYSLYDKSKLNEECTDYSKNRSDYGYDCVDSVPSAGRSKVSNYNLDLEDDEEDACIGISKVIDKVKNTQSEINKSSLFGSSCSGQISDLGSSEGKSYTPVTIATGDDMNVGQGYSYKYDVEKFDLQPMKVDITPQYSPSKDSGYNSPRILANSDSNSTFAINGSRSYDTQGQIETKSAEGPKFQRSSGAAAGGFSVTDNSKIVSPTPPQRPARRKSLSRKSSSDLSTPKLQLSPRQPDSNIDLDLNNDVFKQSENSCAGITTNGSKTDSSVKNLPISPPVAMQRNLRSSVLDQRESQGQIVKGQSDSSRSNEVSEKKEAPPRARPRAHRRLTRRSISFKRLEEDEYIGFASLPEQVHRKAVRRGFEFTLMVVGETGLGKSTLINSLFLMDLYKDRHLGNIEDRIKKTTDIEKKELEIEERGVKLKLTIVDTPGFNDAINAEESWAPIIDYIDGQFQSYFRAESGLNRKNIVDTRVHCCLYFISPYGHGLRQYDIMVMKKLHHKVNIIPLIAKSDMLTKQECKRLKEKVLEEIQRNRIDIYQYPECDSDEEEQFKQHDRELKNSIPFSVVGSNTVVEAGGKKIRGRMYPWGIVEVENPLHSDFTKLRQMLISTHMQDLKEVTVDVHYENYRAEHISGQMATGQRERSKLKRDSAINMESSLETEILLQEKDAEIKRMQEMLSKMQAQLHSSNSPRINGRVAHQV